MKVSCSGLFTETNTFAPFPTGLKAIHGAPGAGGTLQPDQLKLPYGHDHPYEFPWLDDPFTN